ncbi:MAG: transporter [Nitrospinae bacterium]|nr:transporter [Nitrospinota bacterium]
MYEVLAHNPLLYLFIVAAVGYPLGRIKIFGCSLGVAAVLFAGLLFGSLHPELKLPEIIYILGLALFVYTIGLSSGPSFASSFRKEGVRNNALALGAIFFATVATVLAAWALNIKSTLASGMFAGSLTNTPALAAMLETLKSIAPKEVVEKALSEPVIAYSITYPMGVVGILLAITLAQRIWKVDYEAEAAKMKDVISGKEPLITRTFLVTRNEATYLTIREMFILYQWNAAFGRVKRSDDFFVAVGETKLMLGDLVAVVGPHDELEKISHYLGEPSAEHIEQEKGDLEVRRIFVSNPKVAGRKLKELKVDEKYCAVVTRLRRGDSDEVVSGSTILELGDRVRVVARRDRMAEVSAFFGDSYRAVSEVDIMTFSLGLAMGLLAGILPITLPGGTEVKLGFAGGPLVAGLVLGALGRTGPMVWNIPYSANMTLRQIGLVMFLAGVGTRAGYGFVNTFMDGGGLVIFFAGAVITFTTSMLALTVGYKLLKIPFGALTGMVAGIHTQPAALGFALEQARSDIPNLGYSSVYPAATITKILLAQLLLANSFLNF